MCDPSAPESSTLTTRLPSHPIYTVYTVFILYHWKGHPREQAVCQLYRHTLIRFGTFRGRGAGVWGHVSHGGGKCPVAPHTGGNGRTARKTPDDPSSCGTAETAERRRAVTGRGPAPRRTTPGRARRGRPGPPGSTCPRAEAARTAPAPPGRDRRRPLPTPSDESSPPSSGLNIETRDPSSSRVGDTLGGPHVDTS